jgi:hypothetical protein
MTRKELKEYFGMDSFMEFFQFIQSTGHAGKEKIKVSTMIVDDGEKLLGNKKEKKLELELRMNDIKSWAFDEIYACLPLKSSMEVIDQIVTQCFQGGYGGEALSHVKSLLQKIPTRFK